MASDAINKPSSLNEPSPFINTDAINTPENSAITLNKFGVYNFVDESGNVTQIKKSVKKRLLYYPDRINKPVIEPCVIGVSGDVGRENCTPDIAMGCGDIGSSSEMAYAIY